MYKKWKDDNAIVIDNSSVASELASIHKLCSSRKL